MNKDDKYIYPDFVVQSMNHIIDCGASDGYPILNKRADLIHLVFNQFNDFPITQQCYSMVWRWLNKMVAKDEREWLKQYWGHANWYYISKLQYSEDEIKRDTYKEFHVMFGALLMYKKRYEIVDYILYYTNSLPAKYPLIPSTFSSILSIYERLKDKNENLYLLKYSMMDLYAGAGEEMDIEGYLIDYLSILLMRLETVNDYNITYSDPLSIPDPKETVEGNQKMVLILDNFKNHIENITDSNKNPNKSLYYLKKDGALKLIKEYSGRCLKKIDSMKQKSQIDPDKKNILISSITSYLDTFKLHIPISDINTINDGEVIHFTQTVQLNENLILSGYEYVENNLNEVLVESVTSQLYRYINFQFLLRSANAGHTIAYGDVGDAIEKLKLTEDFVIYALGVSDFLFKEVPGFSYTGDGFIYGGIPVYRLPVNQNQLLFMKKDKAPQVAYAPLGGLYWKDSKEDVIEVDDKRHFYTQFNVSETDPILNVYQGFKILFPADIRYVRFNISYRGNSDKFILNKVEPISNHIV